MLSRCCHSLRRLLVLTAQSPSPAWLSQSKTQSLACKVVCLFSTQSPAPAHGSLGAHLMIVAFHQDVGLPYMLDPRHPEDTLFFVAESDYRFYPEDCIQDWYQIVMDEGRPSLDENLQELSPAPAGNEPSSPPGMGDEPSPSPAEQESEGHTKRRKFQGWQAAQRTTQQAGKVDISPELRELVQICNRAAMIGRGHFVWLGWCPKGKKRSVPSYGIHLMAITKYGAQRLNESMTSGQIRKWHWDKVVREWLVKENFQNPKVMGACFVWPSVGYYQTHMSGCEPGIGVRVADWDQSYILPGVCPKESDKERWLACWPDMDKGSAEYLEKITFYQRENIWLTQRPPDRWWSTDNDWARLLWNRWWVGSDGDWIGPEWAAKNKGTGKGKNKDKEHQQSPAPANKWELLRRNPDEYEWDTANWCYQPITRLAEQLVTDWDNWKWNGHHSQREWNTRKKSIAMYKRRMFPESDEEQALTKTPSPFPTHMLLPNTSRRGSYNVIFDCLLRFILSPIAYAHTTTTNTIVRTTTIASTMVCIRSDGCCHLHNW